MIWLYLADIHLTILYYIPTACLHISILFFIKDNFSLCPECVYILYNIEYNIYISMVPSKFQLYIYLYKVYT